MERQPHPKAGAPPPAPVPFATYRLQFHKGFTLRQAAELVSYLSDLGVSHVYASPLLTAIPGSSHGYDTCDPTRINPEIGTEEDLAALVSKLRGAGMGLVLDIVPNHMGVGGRENPWWWDVLKNGRESRFARFFDIDWESPDPALRGKVLAPVLADELQEVLTKGELHIEDDNGEPILRYFEHEFPIASNSLPAADLESPEGLRAVLDRQHYRLVHWRRGDRELNYRRFFTITSLAGLRAEDPEVFRATHDLLLAWHARGWIDGFRVDHPDGLRDPEEYLVRLDHSAPHAWIIVEKILTGDERLPAAWPVAGTTGYDFLNHANRLLVSPEGEQAMSAVFAGFTGQTQDFAATAREAKREVLQNSLAAEVSQLARCLIPLVDQTHDALRKALVEIIACLPVYRTYLKPGGIDDDDRQVIEEAAALAMQTSGIALEAIERIRRVLLTEPSEFTARFQQLTGPAMAKGVEDCAFYRYNRLVALNEVGGDPARFGETLETFHHHCIEMLTHWPDTMLASSTHDTKRGEDVRARLCLLSEMPGRWAAAVREWSAMNDSPWPDRNAEYLFYQTLVGAWPLGPDRAQAYMEKAAREAGQGTAWTDIDIDYEEALRGRVTACLSNDRLMAAVGEFVGPLLDPGRINSLAVTLLKLTVPGVPDFYQGSELWDLSLVDPDNRRPVDFALRRSLLDEIGGLSPESIWARREDGLPKLWTIRQALAVRRTRRESFRRAIYQQIPASGSKAAHCVAFLRGDDVVAIVPRLVWQLGGKWADTRLDLPAGEWHDELSGETVSGGRQPLASLLRRFPVALLVRQPKLP